MQKICTTGLGTDRSCKIWIKLHQQFLSSSPDMICDGWTDRQWRSDPYYVTATLQQMTVAGDTKKLENITLEATFCLTMNAADITMLNTFHKFHTQVT